MVLHQSLFSWLLDEFLYFINSLFLNNSFELIIIPEVFELIIPSVRDFTNLNFHLFILLVIRFSVTNLHIIHFLLLLFRRSLSLQILDLLLHNCRLWTFLVSVDHFVSSKGQCSYLEIASFDTKFIVIINFVIYKVEPFS